MTLIHGPWDSSGPAASDPEDHLPVKMPPRPGTEVERVVVDAEIVDETPAPVPVGATRWPGELQPVVAPWLRDAQELRSRAGRVLEFVWHAPLFHGLRLPLYGARLLLASPRGAFRSVAGAGRWVSGAELAEAARAAASDPKAVVRLLEMQQQRKTTRSFMVLLALVAAAGLVVFAGSLRWLLLAAVLAALGFVGRRQDRPIVDRFVVGPSQRKLTDVVVMRGFMAADLCSEKDPIELRTPIMREEPGWGVTLDLPYGTEAVTAIKRRGRIASGLDYDERCVFLTRVRGGDGSARRVRLWVADEDPLAIPAGRSPLLTTARVNFWQPFPLGLDERGNVITLRMLWLSMLIGAVPRMGKTFVARVVALAAALDPDVRIQVYDLKGSPDWLPFRHVAHRLQFGDRPDPETGVDPVEQLLADARDLQAEVDHRYRTLRTLPPDLVPEGKLTEDLARSRSANMPLVLFIVDEVQRAFEHKTYGGDLEDVLTDLAKAAPAVGIMLLCATQKPDKTATPARFRDQFLARFALRVTAWQVSDVILGAGAYSEGYDASRIDEDAQGCGLLRGTGDVKVKGGTVRTYLADGQDAEAVCVRARKLREAAGTLTGVAAGEVHVAERPKEWSVVADLLMVMDSREQKVHSDVLCARLAERWPDRYAEYGPPQLQVALRGCGVETDRNTYAKRPDGTKTTRAGVAREQLLAAGV